MKKILYPEQKKYIESFDKEDDKLVKDMEAFAKENKVPILSRDSAAFLELLILSKKPKRVLELGTAIAYSSIRVARYLKKNSEIHTIEKSKDNIKIAKKNISKSGLSDKIKLLEGDALDVMPKLPKKYDFIFLDADKEDYKRLFEYSLILLKKKGLLFVDNLLWHGYAAVEDMPDSYKNSAAHIKSFNKLFSSEEKLKTTILPIGDGIGLGIKL